MNSQGDRVGLIAFAGRAFLQAPLTIDYDAAIEALNELDTNTIPEGGTNISDAIDAGGPTLSEERHRQSRGDHFHRWRGVKRRCSQDGQGRGRCRRADFHGRRRHAGRLAHSSRPVKAAGLRSSKTSNGQVVKSKLDEKRLSEIAETTGGIYLPSRKTARAR